MSAFNKLATKIRDRNWGGTSQQIAAEPYVTGYFHIAWVLPNDVIRYIITDPGTGSDMSNDQTAVQHTNGQTVSDVLSQACLSVTPPGGTINKTTMNGMGGTKWHAPTSIDYGNTISIRYLEMSGLPILRIHRAWFNIIRDNKSGLTALDDREKTGKQYNKAGYSATLVYWTTKPDGRTVEFACAYSGVFPTRDPQDLFNGDITQIDKLEIDMEYHLDFIHQDPWVYKMVEDNLAKLQPYGGEDNTVWAKKRPYGGEQSTVWARTLFGGYRAPENTPNNAEELSSKL